MCCNISMFKAPAKRTLDITTLLGAMMLRSFSRGLRGQLLRPSKRYFFRQFI